tara:strand:+ start:1055 stop:1204 length:150 start_codon:yes stop_codon:yes gene_type:complete
MKCYHCKSKLIWGGDNTFEDYSIEGEGMVTNLSCSKCPAYYEIFLKENE